MHYKDGTPARIGDVVKLAPEAEKGYGEKFVGLLTHANPGTMQCNGQVLPSIRWVDNPADGRRVMLPAATWNTTVTIGDLLKVA